MQDSQRIWLQCGLWEVRECRRGRLSLLVARPKPQPPESGLTVSPAPHASGNELALPSVAAHSLRLDEWSHRVAPRPMS